MKLYPVEYPNTGRINSLEHKPKGCLGKIVRFFKKINTLIISQNEIKLRHRIRRKNSENTERFRWVSGLTLCEHQLIGTHNSWISRANGWWVHNQSLAVREQLNRGVRLLELDIAAKEKGSALEVVHFDHSKSAFQKRGKFETCKGALLLLKEWLDQNPDEILVIKLDNKRDPNSQMNTIDKVIEEVNLQNYLLKPEHLAEREDKGWPTIEEMRKNNRRLVIINSKTPKKFDHNSTYTHFAGHTLSETDGGVTEFVLKKGKAFTSIFAKNAKFSTQHKPREKKLLILNYSRQIPSNVLSTIAKIICIILSPFSKAYLPRKHSCRVRPTAKNITELQKKYERYDPAKNQRRPNFMGDRVDTLLTPEFFKRVNAYNATRGCVQTVI